MALPGKDNPFTKGLTQKPPVSGFKAKKTFVKIPLSTGISPSNFGENPNSEQSPSLKEDFTQATNPTTVLQQPSGTQTEEVASVEIVVQQLYNNPTTDQCAQPSDPTTVLLQASDTRSEQEPIHADNLQQLDNSPTTDRQPLKPEHTTILQQSSYSPATTRKGNSLSPPSGEGSQNNASSGETTREPKFKKPTTVVQQLDNSPTTNLRQFTDRTVENLQQTYDSFTTKPTTPPTTDVQQFSNNLPHKPTLLFLSDFQLKIVEFIFLELKKRRSTETLPLRSEIIAKYCNRPARSVQTISDRLHDRGFLIKKYGISGPTGGTVYSLPESVYQEFLHSDFYNRTTTDVQQTSNNPTTNHTTKPTTAASSSSSFLLEDSKLTTTEQESKPNPFSPEFSPEWEAIDFTTLTDIGIHFGRPQLKQWFDRKYCGAKEAQESIYHFAYFMTHSPKEKLPREPLNFIMGIMHKSRYFARPDGYLSPEEEAMKRRTDDIKRKNENLRRLQEEYFGEAFETWVNSLTGAQIQSLVPHFSGHERKQSVLKEMFRDQHWTTIRDNPDMDVTTLQVKGQSQEKGGTLLQEKTKHQSEMTQDEVRQIADAQFGKL